MLNDLNFDITQTNTIFDGHGVKTSSIKHNNEKQTQKSDLDCQLTKNLYFDTHNVNVTWFSIFSRAIKSDFPTFAIECDSFVFSQK